MTRVEETEVGLALVAAAVVVALCCVLPDWYLVGGCSAFAWRLHCARELGLITDWYCLVAMTWRNPVVGGFFVSFAIFGFALLIWPLMLVGALVFAAWELYRDGI